MEKEKTRNTCSEIKEPTPDFMEAVEMLENLELNKPDKPTKFYYEKKEYYIKILSGYDGL